MSGSLLNQQLAAEEVAGASMPSSIESYSIHGLDQAISRDGVGVSTSAILDAVNNPLSIEGQSGGRFLFSGQNANVVLNSQGNVITVWAENSGGWRMVP